MSALDYGEQVTLRAIYMALMALAEKLTGEKLVLAVPDSSEGFQTLASSEGAWITHRDWEDRYPSRRV